MPAFGPIKRKDLVRYLQKAGFAGPFSGGNREFMLKGDLSIWVPNPHRGDIGKDFLARILRQARIERNEWEAL